VSTTTAGRVTTTQPKRKKISDRAKAERRLGWLLCAPAVIVMLLVAGYPIINAFVLSLQRADLRFPDANKFIGFDNYGTVLSSSLWWQDVFHTLIITGTLTNCCCESTARDAMQMNYKIIFVSDANAALTDAAHNATLENMAMLFADVMTTGEVLTAITRTLGAMQA